MEYKLKMVDQKAIYDFWKHLVKHQIQNFIFTGSIIKLVSEKSKFDNLSISTHNDSDSKACYIGSSDSKTLWVQNNFSKYYAIKFNRLCKIIRKYQKYQAINEFDVSKYVPEKFIPVSRSIEIRALRNEVMMVGLRCDQTLSDYSAIIAKIGV